MGARKNPNPICPCCGRHVKTIGNRSYSQWSDRKAYSYTTECNNVISCRLTGGENSLKGHGATMKAARENYLTEAAKRQDGE